MMETPVGSIHVWSEGDSWWDIAARYSPSGLNWVHLVEANPQVWNPNKVPVGTRVLIPRELFE